MFRTFIQTQEFSRKWDNLGLNDDDLRLLELDIINNMVKKKKIIFQKRKETQSGKQWIF